MPCLGIGVFTLLGLQKGLAYDLHPFVSLIMGMISAVFGGVIRDVLTNQVPLIFKKEIYASACLLGGVFYLVAIKLSIPESISFVIGVVMIIIIRLIVVRYHLELPKIKRDIFGKIKE